MLSKILKWRLFFGFVALTSVYILFLTSFGATISHMAIVKKSRGQKVISFSLYNMSNLNERYLPGIMGNYLKMKEFYPGWVMRVYTNIDNLSSLYYQRDLYFYDPKNIPDLGDMSEMRQTLWRFLPIGDPSVDIFISRDLDSLIGERERAAVAQWENADSAIFHLMRDHPWHGVALLAGMWGAKNYLLNVTTREYLQNEFIKIRGKEEIEFIKNRGTDQVVLDKIFWHNSDFDFKDSFMCHDSYYCKYYDNTTPFPTQRKNLTDFVGNYGFGLDPKNATECPVECRPTYGKDWAYC